MPSSMNTIRMIARIANYLPDCTIKMMFVHVAAIKSVKLRFRRG